MSYTPSIGCYKASYWNYSAEVIKGSLEKAKLNHGTVDTIPVNVLRDARTFFKITLEQKSGDGYADHITARLHAQTMAWRWLAPIRPSIVTKAEFKELIQKFLSLLELLSHTKKITLDIGGLATAKQLIVFYKNLILEADNERDERMASSHHRD